MHTRANRDQISHQRALQTNRTIKTEAAAAATDDGGASDVAGGRSIVAAAADGGGASAIVVAATMHTFNETAAGVPAFLAKLWRLVEDPETNHLIYWQQDGHSFVIQNQAQFARELLPLNYKHNNMASFIRQLNMYGFHKITSIDNGGLKFDKDEMEFMHACFRKDSPFLLEHIKRKIANPKPNAQSAAVAAAAAAAAAAVADDTRTTIRPETVAKVMNEVKTMRTRQESLDSRFSAMKQENEALWREVAILRQKHAKQQQIVNKLIQFLVTLVQPARPGSGINNMSGVKRRFQLMINDVPESSKSSTTPAAKTTAGASDGDDHLPAIRELTDELFDEDDYDYDETASPHVLSPGPSQAHSEHGASALMAEDISSPTSFSHDAEQTSTSIVDHPDSESDYDHDNEVQQLHNDVPFADDPPRYGQSAAITSADDMNFVIYELNATDAAAPVSTTSPTQEWLESHILSPQMIKQEQQEVGGYAAIDAEHTYTLQASCQNEQQLPAKRARYVQPQAVRSPRQKAAGLHLNIGKNGGPSATTPQSQHKLSNQSNDQQQQHATVIRNPMISGIATETLPVVVPAMPSTSRDLKRMHQEPHQQEVTQQVYANKADFISSEMPAELFDMRAQDTVPSSVAVARNAAVGSMSPLLGELSSANFNPTLSEDYSKRLTIPPAGPGGGASGSGSIGGKNMAVAKYGTKGIGKLAGTEEVNMQLESIQGDLESIKELFKGDDYTLDTSALMGSGGIGAKNRLMLSPTVDSELFSKIFGDLDAPFGLSLSPDFSMENKRTEDTSGSELMTYQPTCYGGNSGGSTSHVDLSQLLCDSANNEKHNDDDEDGHREPQPDYLTQDLNTPNVERKSISFRTRNDI